jgi:hypothetical protein
MGWSLSATAALVLGACSTEVDEQCVVARAVFEGSTGSFATTYTLKEGQTEEGPCTQLKPEPVGLQKFYRTKPSDRDTVAIRTARMGKLMADFKVTPDPESPNKPYSVGALTTEFPGTDNFCQVPLLESARLEVAGQSFTYDWSNLRIYNTPEIPGTQFVADLRYTENGCTAQYSVKGIWPVVRCGKTVTVDGVKQTVADPTLCDPKPDFEAGRLRGSGINPIFPVTCAATAEATTFICVLTGEVPSDRQP